jgi:hypothetical protein
MHGMSVMARMAKPVRRRLNKRLATLISKMDEMKGLAQEYFLFDELPDGFQSFYQACIRKYMDGQR